MNSEKTYYRDRGLGAALRELEVPEHREGFFGELDARLAAERAGRRPRRYTAAFGRAPRMSRLFAVAAVASLAALLFITLGLPHLRTGSDVARAAVIRTQVMNALAEARTIRGQLVYSAFDARSGKMVVTHQAFAADSDGDFRLATVGGVGDSAYDASQGVERAVTTSASIGSGRFFAEVTGLAPGPPDQVPTDFILDRELGAVVRALVAAHNPRVEEVSFDGRPAWRLDTPIEPNTIEADVDHLEITVDRQSGFPVRVLSTLRGAVRSELRLDDLAVNEALPADEFTVDFPPNAEILRTNEGFAYVDREAAATAVGYQPLMPSEVPDGFHLTAIAVAKNAAPTGPGESNPPSVGVVSLSYRRGLDQFVVTTRRRGAGPWQDPFAVEGVHLATSPVNVEGPLAGASANLVIDPRVVPHLWAVTNRFVITVAGDLDRAELIQVAQSLR